MLKEKKEQENRKKTSGTAQAPGKTKHSSPSPSIPSSRSHSSLALADNWTSNKRQDPPPGRSAPKCVKRKQNKKGGSDTVDLLVMIDLSRFKLEVEEVAEYKEVFMLFDKDQDGVLSFPELSTAMKTLGQRPSEPDLLKMVRSVSEDKLYDTIEFNEFLQMMSKQQEDDISMNALVEAFKTFDKDKDGFLTTDELKKIMKDRMTKKDIDTMIKEADSGNYGMINYQDFCSILCAEGGNNCRSRKDKKNSERIKDEDERNESGRSDSLKTLSKG